MRFLLIIPVILFLGLSCKTGETSGTKAAADNNSSADMKGPRVAIECNLYDYDYKSAGPAYPDMFPYVYQGAGRSRIFEAYTVRFQLTHQPPLVPMTNYEIPWIKPDNYNDQNGNFITYIRNGYEKSLANPYISVQYIRKDVPHASSIDSLLHWVNGIVMDLDGAKVLTAEYKIETVSGKTARCQEFKYPDQGPRAGKTLAYAYIDFNDEYIVGLVLTTVNDTDYPLNKPLFEELIRSFCT
ncbi:MAG: hypothetical protein AAFY71_12510 [Bacteroidota bacterium]